jgi:Carboxypeptidase regulatory-like domain
MKMTRRQTKTRKKRKKVGTKLALLFCLAPFFVAPLSCFAQVQAPTATPTGASFTRSILGTVLDVNGTPVSGAVVLLKDTKTLQVRSYIVRQDGRYHFYGLSSDINYELRAQANGVTSPSKTVSVFDSHKIVKLNLKLKKKLKT